MSKEARGYKRTIFDCAKCKFCPLYITMNCCSLIRNISGELFREYLKDGSIKELPHDPGDILVLFPVYGDLIVLNDFKLYRVKDCLGAAFVYYSDMMVQVFYFNGFWTGDIV